MRFNTITFLSDYGLTDEFVGVVHSVIRSIAPEVRVIDLNHNVAPHDVRAGGLALARSVQFMAPGVVLAVVDPGVGTARRPVAIEVADGEAFLIGPDNGLLAPAVAMVGGATGAVVLDDPDYHLPRLDTSSTFDGRDVFAPAAAHLCLGVPLAALGSSLDPSQLLPGLLPVSDLQDDGTMKAEVLWIDRFGNAQLNVDPDDLAGWPDTISVRGGRLPRNATRVDTFAEIPPGGVGLLIDSYGLLALAVDRGSAAVELELTEGTELMLSPVADVVGSPVRLSAKPPSRERPEDETFNDSTS
ncbi:MAG: SAM-dependent chlorinase/fluorinase [Acidimicrobiia bacterium]|nr:SAM-dependent chlorinase/fluorinase [Acidimicrobiia bacterium]